MNKLGESISEMGEVENLKYQLTRPLLGCGWGVVLCLGIPTFDMRNMYCSYMFDNTPFIELSDLLRTLNLRDMSNPSIAFKFTRPLIL